MITIDDIAQARVRPHGKHVVTPLLDVISPAVSRFPTMTSRNPFGCYSRQPNWLSNPAAPWGSPHCWLAMSICEIEQPWSCVPVEMPIWRSSSRELRNANASGATE
ncbi:hypothetical protein JQ617_14600 [Bradyrhizobium sp. KB893862 SZCCT0404]|uniref:hypothetical protein n=1 Tax=Bradyrhizobium sp. KB893862 SZCCT0404 TaxID=2807672 RepID=UPI001BAD22FE|nr:hypothetical protein [Bradyrhizobium sp. KB893862 SZCCT0404]MBR1175196.1 hypothetical protein [Bradyrhizobium sp. KB893862 SZCCT0404]